MNVKKLTIEITAADEGGFVVAVREMPGCCTQGENVPEALRNLAEAIEALEGMDS